VTSPPIARVAARLGIPRRRHGGSNRDHGRILRPDQAIGARGRSLRPRFRRHLKAIDRGSDQLGGAHVGASQRSAYNRLPGPAGAAASLARGATGRFRTALGQWPGGAPAGAVCPAPSTPSPLIHLPIPRAATREAGRTRRGFRREWRRRACEADRGGCGSAVG
jgi:hypothetical protein